MYAAAAIRRLIWPAKRKMKNHGRYWPIIAACPNEMVSGRAAAGGKFVASERLSEIGDC